MGWGGKGGWNNEDGWYVPAGHRLQRVRPTLSSARSIRTTLQASPLPFQ
jgi:hypothetical protein